MRRQQTLEESHHHCKVILPNQSVLLKIVPNTRIKYLDLCVEEGDTSLTAIAVSEDGASTIITVTCSTSLLKLAKL
ncbi:hypothetical protein SADUNF_Sadunf17G0019100 [Salix dunnii]|uniref:Uncharacterized protein n=1 Tax=Salix dunnii TaxID=1413687 RepID=A0A835J497_9ROSI|nr:hypothetical protein SADUNF_Sadunf17G0019100 [Salix dunnii]